MERVALNLLSRQNPKILGHHGHIIFEMLSPATKWLAASQTIPRPERLVEGNRRPVHRPFRTNSMGRVTRHWRVWLISEVASRQTPFAHDKGRRTINPQKRR